MKQEIETAYEFAVAEYTKHVNKKEGLMNLCSNWLATEEALGEWVAELLIKMGGE